MSGIDKIIKEIEENSAAVCDEILENARIKADGILSDANKTADSILSSSEEKTAVAVKDIADRAASAALIEEKKTVLLTKQEIISSMLKEALKKAKELPVDAYFKLILKMIEKNQTGASGKICMCRKDLDRLPSGFEKEIAYVSSGALTLSEEPALIDSGFILLYDGIDVNCSFDAVFRSEWEELCDSASGILF